MADVRDWGRFIRGRWDWTAGGYEQGFPRRCGFTDIDAAVEFDSRSLLIETKHYDGVGALCPLSNGQRQYLEDEVLRGKTVLVLYGCGPCNDPHAAYDVGRRQLHDWRELPKPERRRHLKALIDQAMGLT